MPRIANMRVVSDDPTLLHHNSLQPVALGTIETIDGKQYKVIDNTQMGVVVTYAPHPDPKRYECPHLGCDNIWNKTRAELRSHLQYWHNATPQEADKELDKQ